MFTRIIQSVTSTAGNRTNLTSVKLMVDSVTQGKCGMKNHYANCCDNFRKNDNKTPVHAVEHNNDNTDSIVFSVNEQSTSKA